MAAIAESDVGANALPGSLPETDVSSTDRDIAAMARQGPDLRPRIRALVAAAAANRVSVSAHELALLMPEASFASPQGFEGFLATDEALAREISIIGGELVPRGRADLVRAPDATTTAHRLQEAHRLAAELARMCPGVRLVAVSGSTAYGRPRPEDDLDFFVVTSHRRAWVALSLALLLARILRGRDPRRPMYCFNRTFEVEGCEETFRVRQEPLFAREALNLRVVFGEAYYRVLLDRGAWMAAVFPFLFRSRTGSIVAPEATRRERARLFWTAANLVAFLVTAPYLYFAGLVRNRRFAKAGNRPAQFRTVVRSGACAYESRKYDDLREMYREAF